MINPLREIKLRFDYLCNYNGYGSYEQYIHENVHIYEMSNFVKSESDLPMNVWLDTSGSYTKGGHWKRLKFQLNYADKIQNDRMGVMTISSNPKTIISPKAKVELSERDIELLRQFVIKYEDYLSSLADQKINYTQFLNKYNYDKGKTFPDMNIVKEMIEKFGF